MLKTSLSVSGGAMVKKTTSSAAAQPIFRPHARQAVQANLTSSLGAPASVLSFGGPQYHTMFQGIAPEYNEAALLNFYRDCYYYDNTAGSSVDLLSEFPFSDFTLSGVDNRELAIFNESLARLNIRSLTREIAHAHLVDGAFAGTLIYDAESRLFQDIMIHDIGYAQISPQPFHSLDPVISVNATSRLQQFMGTSSPYLEAVLRTYPKGVLERYMSGQVVLDPLTTLYVPRKALQDRTHVSFLKRILPIYMLEKVLFRGTLIEASKRQRATSHISVGNENWIPTDEELQMTLNQFQMSELDPLGAWIATREGVSIQDIRTGGDFWKWTDVIDQMTPHKLRSLGISEAFLSGDASYACLAGDSLIPTTKGLRRIDSFGEGKDRKKVVKINAVMDSRFKPQRASSWQYNGFQSTIRVRTKTGNSIQATANHPLLVFTGDRTEWKRTDQIQVGDVLCVSRNRVVRPATDRLKLNAPIPDPRERRHQEVNRSGNGIGMVEVPQNSFNPGDLPWVPSHMTPKLAYWLALFISEGYTIGGDSVTTAERSSCRIGFKNTDRRLVNRFKQLAEELFGVEVKGGDKELTPEAQNNRGGEKSFIATKSCWAVYVINRRLIDWLESIGVYVTPGRIDDKLPSYYKCVPWSVLQADVESQKAFLAAYAECDGCVGKRTSWISVSPKIRDQIRAMLNSHGYQPTEFGTDGHPCKSVVLYGSQAEEFWITDNARAYLSSKEFKGTPKYSHVDGVPAGHWKSLLKARKVGWDRHGQKFLCDDGEIIQVSTSGVFKEIAFNDLKRFNYVRYQEGFYDEFLRLLKNISPSAYFSLKRCLDTPYRYTEVTSIEDAGKEHVYDISMPSGKEPAFVANGLVVHNTAEAAISVFLDSCDSFRQFITYKIFTSKLFPMIAVLHGMYRDPKKAHKVNNVGDLMKNIMNHNNLLIPTVQWHKSLTGKDSDSQWDMLDKLSEKGFSIPLKMWAAAANVDIGSLVRDLSEDRQIRESIEKVTGRKAEAQGVHEDLSLEEEFEDSGLGEQASAIRRARLSTQAGLRSANSSETSRRIPLLARDDMNTPIIRMGKGDKIHAVVNERRAVAKVNDNIIKAMDALSDPNYREAVRKKVKAKLGPAADLKVTR